MGYWWQGGYRGCMFSRRKQWRGRCGKARLNQGETLGYVFWGMRVHCSSHLGRNQYREGGGSRGDQTLRCGELKRLPKCEEPTTGSFRVRAKRAQDNVGRNRRGRRGGARRIYPREYRRRRGRGCRSECRVDLHLKGAAEEVNEVRGEDEGDDYQGGIGDNEDSKSEEIQVGSWLGRMHKWAV